MKKSVIIGLGISGKASAAYLSKKGYQLIGVDREPCKCDFEVVSESAPVSLQGVELVIKSPGVPPSHPWICRAKQEGISIMGEIDLALKELKTREKTLFAITGSNGKTTTTLLTAHLLQLAGKKVVATGNIGTPLISKIDADADIFVVELSSFQLENILPEPVVNAAVIVNITENHLDRHGSYLSYAQAKCRLQYCLRVHSPLFIPQSVLDHFPTLVLPETKREILESFEKKVETILSLVYTKDRSRFYAHDYKNFCAAYALAQTIGISEDTFQKGVATFQKPPHRIEFVREVGKVRYVNDSKATNVDAVKKAVEGISSEVILIAGGRDKGGAFGEWISLFRKKVVLVLAIGEAAERICRELGGAVEVEMVGVLEAGVSKACLLAKAGQTVLFSPGCSSFDQFNNYQHRGEVFKQLVCAIEEKGV